MSADPNPTPEISTVGKTQDKPPSLGEITKWLTEDSVSIEKQSEILEQALAGEFGELPAEFLANAKALLAKRREENVLRLTREKLEGIKALLERPAASMPADDRLAQCHSMMEEVTDVLLDVPEPRRTSLFQQFLPLREMLARLRAE